MQKIGQSAGASCLQYSTFPGAHPCREQHLPKWVAPKWSRSGLSIIRSYQSLADISRQPIRTPGLGWRNRGLHLSSSDFTERWSGSGWMRRYYSLKERKGKKKQRLKPPPSLSVRATTAVRANHVTAKETSPSMSESQLCSSQTWKFSCYRDSAPAWSHVGCFCFFCPSSASLFHLPPTLIRGLSLFHEIQIGRMWLNALYLLMRPRGTLKVKLEETNKARILIGLLPALFCIKKFYIMC